MYFRLYLPIDHERQDLDNEGMNNDHQEELLDLVLSLHCAWAEASCYAASSIGVLDHWY
jgi:hypothetical protein